ncbi:MAG TPA: hypothetical protein VH539_25335 [Gemmatimonadaceae bacterium]|jgi:hypothetical protein
MANLSPSTTRRLASRAYLVGCTLFGVAGIAAFTRSVAKPRFDEIDVERINIIAPNGKPRLVISNAERAPDVIINGKTYHRSGSNEAGMIFYNEEGSENGGMGFSGHTRNGHVSANAGFMFDQYGQDQTVGLTYDEQDGRRSAGLRVWDRPNQSVTVLADLVEPIKQMPDGPEKTRRMKAMRDSLAKSGLGGAQRVFVGKQSDKTAMVMLADAQSRPRLRMVVDSAGAARIEFLDDSGRVIRTFAASDR